jgi:hypothetical protein
MTRRPVLSAFVWLFVVGIAVPLANAQKYEVHPYAGVFNPDRFILGELKTEGIYGVTAGLFLNEWIELEANLGYINHFEFKGTDPKTRGLLWEGLAAYHLPSRKVGGTEVIPFISLGLGGLTARLPDGETALHLAEQNIFIEDPVLGVTRPFSLVRPISMENNNTFFIVSYGGGVKALRLWGPMGLRGEIRGRTMPNFFGEFTNWLEVSGGVTFTWGER